MLKYEQKWIKWKSEFMIQEMNKWMIKWKYDWEKIWKERWMKGRIHESSACLGSKSVAIFWHPGSGSGRICGCKGQNINQKLLKELSALKSQIWTVGNREY